MIEFTNKDLNSETIESLNNLLALDVSPSDASQLLKIAHILRGIIDNKNFIYNKILKKYGTPEKDGSVLISNENMDKYSNDLGELMDIPHSIDSDILDYDALGIDKIKTIDLDNIKFIFGIETNTKIEMSDAEKKILDSL